MLKLRVIPCLDVKDGRVVKGVNFVSLRDAGDPVEQAALYDAAGADELCFLDITASHENRDTILDVVSRTAARVFLPLTVGGGIRSTEDMRRLLTCDHLTGASNRRHFSQIMEREQTHWREVGQPLSLVLLDLDHFKTVNDTHGHPVGDILLRRVAEVCTMLLPPRGVFARLGGEEFGALLPRRDNDQAIGLAEAMRTAIGICNASQTPVAMPQPTRSLPSRIERGSGLRLLQPNASAPWR